MNNQKYHLKYFKVIIIILVIALSGRSTIVYGQSKPWVAPGPAANKSNPVAGNAEALKNGKILYTTYCTPCHGVKGKGDGVAASALNPKPADHSSPAMLNETDGALFYKISEGRSPMPTYKAKFTESQRWELVTYIRTLCKVQKK